jgi:hypothetical protein
VYDPEVGRRWDDHQDWLRTHELAAYLRVGNPVKKRDDLNDVIREESSRGRKRPINTAAINEKAERRDAVIRIFRRERSCGHS